LPSTEIDVEHDDAVVWSALNDWKQEVGFVPATIHVEAFHMPALRIGIDDLPDSFKRFLANPEAVPHPIRRHHCHEDIRELQATTKYVLRWGEEYWMDSTGNVIAT